MKTTLTCGVVALMGFLFSAAMASAQAAPSPTPSPTPVPKNVNLATTSPLPLIIDGLESDRLPTAIAGGSTVCITDRQYYKTEGERWTFQGWSNGSTQDCINPSKAGAYKALFSHEVLLVIRSAAADFQHSEWVAYGVPVDMEVPSTVNAREDGNSRYRFVQWSDGENPYDTHNTIAPVKPTALDVKWVLEHKVTVDGPADATIKGSGWYADGTNLVLQAQDIVPSGKDGERSKFKSWQSSGQPTAVIGNASSAQATLKIDAPYSVSAAYDKQFYVSATTPAGTLKHDWVNDGQDLVIEAPATLDVIPERERLVFKRWTGVDGIQSPRFGGPVDRPVSVSAVYERELMLKVDAPLGVSGDGWQKAGTVASVTVPQFNSTMFLFRNTFAGFSGYAQDQNSVQIMMSEPVSLAALYRTEIDLRVLAVLLLVPFAALILILSYRWVPALWRLRPRRRSEPQPVLLGRLDAARTVAPLQHKQG